MLNYETETVEFEKITGFVLPVGNGAVGKTSISNALDLTQQQKNVTEKSMNLEFGYVIDRLVVRQRPFQVLQQYLVPPGQKAIEGNNEGRSYEEIIKTYRFMFKRIDVVLLSFRIVEMESFNDLEFWVNQALELSNPLTQFILVGTHLDMDGMREVTPNMIQNGSDFVRSRIVEKFPGWEGKVPAIEISTTRRQNLELLKNAVSVGILRARCVFNQSQPVAA